MLKAGGKMADSGSVLFNFRRQGLVFVKADGCSEEQVCVALHWPTNATCSWRTSWESVGCCEAGAGWDEFCQSAELQGSLASLAGD